MFTLHLVNEIMMVVGYWFTACVIVMLFLAARA